MPKIQTTNRCALVMIAIAITSSLSGLRAQVTTGNLSEANLVRNSSFERGLESWDGSGTLNLDSARDGLNSLRLNADEQRSQVLKLEVGQVYELRAWGKVTSGKASVAVLMGNTPVSLTFDGANWQEKKLEFTASESTARLELHGTTGGDFLVDFVQLYSKARLEAMSKQVQQTLEVVSVKGSVALTTAAYRKGTGKPSVTVSLEQPKSRNPRLWPFAKDSIWNSPIGSGAVYIPARLEPAETFSFDQDLVLEAGTNAVWREVYLPGNWGRGRCLGAGGQTLRGQVLLPDGLTVADATDEPNETPNNAAAILAPDGRTLVQFEPMTRCEGNGPIFGYRATDQDLYGAGLWGGHFGSGLSSIGGTIRQGELLGDGPIRHALKLKLWAKKYFRFDRTSTTPGFRWPAIRADASAGDPNAPSAYGKLEPAKSNPVKGLVMGSLLAIPPTLTLESLQIDPKLKLYPVIRKLFVALQNYGGYVDDDTNWDAHYLGVEYGVNEELQAVFGEGLEAGGKDTLEAINKLFVALSLVNNNSPVSIGGGGMPLAPLAPDFDKTAPTSKLRALERKGWTLDAFASAEKHPVGRMIDGRAGTFWRSGRPQGSFQDVRINLGKAFTLRQMRMISGAFGQESYHRWAKDFVLETSMDGKNWTVVAGAGGAPSMVLSFKPIQAQHLRITEMNPDAGDWAISDLQFYE